MNKIEAKKVLKEISKIDKPEATNCRKCPLNEKFEVTQKEIFNVLKENKLHDISICSSRFLYLCIKYNVKKLNKLIEYAKNVTGENGVFLDNDVSDYGCPCEYLNILAKYLLRSGENLDIE